MTQAREPDDRGLDRTIRSFDRVENQVSELNGKIVTILRHITGQGNS